MLFALNIERAGTDGLAPLIHPNHLLFTAAGFLAYWPLHWIWPGVRALPVLQGLDIGLSVAAALVLGRLVQLLYGDRYLSAGLTGLFAFGAEWWKFSVDADAYILATLLLLLAARALIIGDKRRLLTAGTFHCGAMLIHQLGLLFLPAVCAAIWNGKEESPRRRGRLMAVYTASTGAITLTAYYAGYRLSRAGQQDFGFVRWLSSHSGDSSFTAHPGYILAGTAKSYVQLLFGGRVRLLGQFFEPWMWMALVLLLAGAAFFVLQTWRGRRDWKPIRLMLLHELTKRPEVRIAAAWAIPYALFLLIWLPRNTFYKLLLWPALILLLAALARTLRIRPDAHRGLLVSLVAVECCWNLLFFVYPYSKTRANPVLAFAEQANRVWNPNALIFFKRFDTDDWTVRYAAPQTSWKPLDCSGPACLPLIGAEVRKGEVWLDPTSFEYLQTASPETSRWMEEQRSLGKLSECCGSRWPLRFHRLAP